MAIATTTTMVFSSLAQFIPSALHISLESQDTTTQQIAEYNKDTGYNTDDDADNSKFVDKAEQTDADAKRKERELKRNPVEVLSLVPFQLF